MKISIASGKGGTGKTTIAVNMALSLTDVQYIDCDVEEPNGHLFLNPKIKKNYNAHVPIPEINVDKCILCGKCIEVCEYKALAKLPTTILIFKELCHGCGACSYLCPEKAISEIQRDIGIIETGACANMMFVHGKLNIGESMAPPLIRQLLQNKSNSYTIIIDSPPGTSCSMVNAVKGSDYILLVTEPTVFGLNDLKMAVDVISKLSLPFSVVINKSNDDDVLIENFCNEKNIPVLMKLPFDTDIAKLYSQGIPVALKNSEIKDKFLNLFKSIQTHYMESKL